MVNVDHHAILHTNSGHQKERFKKHVSTKTQLSAALILLKGQSYFVLIFKLSEFWF